MARAHVGRMAHCNSDGSLGATPQVPEADGVVSVDKEDSTVSMEFDNRGCDRCSWRLFWITPEGERKQYGEVQKGATFQQITFPGHTWLLEASGETTATARRELRCLCLARFQHGLA